MTEDLPGGPGSWLVVTTHSHREEFAAVNLAQQGFTTYCPMIVKRIRHARRICDASRPLFPGYIFAESCGRSRLRSLLGTYGVRSVVWSGETPARLPDTFVAGLKARETGGVIQGTETALKPGQRVEINGGPFDGLIAQIVEIRESDRVLVLLNLLQRETKVFLDSAALELR